MLELSEIFSRMKNAVIEANQKVLEIYKKGFKVDYKEDKTPVTNADLSSDQIIRKYLADDECFFLSEEEQDDLSRLNKKCGFVIDPLDGTSDFVNHDDSFSINIAYVVDNIPIVAFIGLPYYQEYVYAIKNEGCYYVFKDGKIEKLHVSSRKDNLVYLASKTHETEDEKKIYIKHKEHIKEVIRSGASTKAVLLAKGIGDCSIRFTPYTKEWDICAPDLIVKEAGGIFVDSKLNEFSYNRKDVYNKNGYAMFNCKENEFLLN